MNLKLLALLTLVFAATALAQVPSQSADPNLLRVQLLSGKTGRPVTAQHMLLLSPDHKFHSEQKTDGEGYATLPTGDLPPKELEVWVDFHEACSKAHLHTFDAALIRARGVVSENTCSKHIHMFPQPGTLIFFIRDQTFFEKMRH